jgi:hypothetical protein
MSPASQGRSGLVTLAPRMYLMQGHARASANMLLFTASLGAQERI